MASGKIENGKETLADTVYEQIRRDIVGHVLLPGQKLKTKELSARYGVSETPVKLALNRLCTEHIIDNYPRQGMKVHEFSPDEAGEIFDIRRMMDLYYTKEVIDTVASNRIFQEEMLKECGRTSGDCGRDQCKMLPWSSIWKITCMTISFMNYI